jgi:hypothetical protein
LPRHTGCALTCAHAPCVSLLICLLHRDAQRAAAAPTCDVPGSTGTPGYAPAHEHRYTAKQVRRLCVQIPKTGKGKKASQPVNKDRFVSKMFLRGDSVVMVLRNPK